MTLTGAIVLFAVIWFLSLLVALPIGLNTQGDLGEVEPGTPASADGDGYDRLMRQAAAGPGNIYDEALERYMASLQGAPLPRVH